MEVGVQAADGSTAALIGRADDPRELSARSVPVVVTVTCTVDGADHPGSDVLADRRVRPVI
jgi:hypothetical protein